MGEWGRISGRTIGRKFKCEIDYLINIRNHMSLTPEEIAKNIASLKEKMGDARTGGKGTQRRKVKVVQKNQVL